MSDETRDQAELDAHHHHHGELYRPLMVTPEDEQNIREVAANRKKLQAFDETEKTGLKLLLSDVVELHALADSKRSRAKLGRRALWLVAQIMAFVAALEGLNEIISNYFKLRGAK